MYVFRKSGKRDSDPRPQPWQGCALPTELFPQLCFIKEGISLNADAKVILFFETPNFFLFFFSKNVLRSTIFTNFALKFKI